MNIAEIMTKKPIYADSADTIREALNKMAEYDIRHLPVLEGSELVGIVSDRDIKLYNFITDPGNLESDRANAKLDQKINTVMQTSIISIDINDEVSSVVRLMIDNRIGAVPVVDATNNKLVGIVSYIDILKHVEDLL